PGRGPRGDLVLAFRDAVHDALVAAFSREPDPAYTRRMQQEGMVLGLLQSGVAHALALLDPALRALVRPFHRAMRWPVYEAVATDTTGRVGQLARAVPGVLSFALTHASDSDAQGLAAAQAFREEVVRGTPLQRALAPLLEDWSLFGARGRRRPVRRGRFGLRPDTLAALAALPGEARARRVREQQLLLRRALPQVGGGLLWLPPPLELVPEDIPRTPRAQVRWFKAMKRWVAFTAEWPDVDLALQRSFVRWLSAHAVEVSQLKHATAASLFDHVRAVGRATPRRLAVERLQREMDQHARVRAGQPPPGPVLAPPELVNAPFEVVLAALAAELPVQRLGKPGAPADLRLPNPVPGTCSPGLRVTPLLRASQLQDEGREMNHCVAGYLAVAARGRAWFFSAEAAGMRLTVQVHRDAAGHSALGRFLGHTNRAPTPEATALIHDWWARTSTSLGLRLGAAPPPGEPPPEYFEQDLPEVPF
ncbi:MAG: hypothetical protein FJ086_15275, partial [Deltaproteobacteria bacterium]|nr:hypothetical protein [Deltaproteobacteria bacterium]